jgi:hypothetical protein
MKVFALFDDNNYESISLEFLQPQSKGGAIEITYLQDVNDNIRESADRGIKEAYFLLSKYYLDIPQKIYIWYRGFEKRVQGNSADIAFAVALMDFFFSEGYIKSDISYESVCATGVINKSGEICAVSGIKEKVIAAIRACKGNSKSLLLIPQNNYSEYLDLLKTNPDITSSIREIGMKVVGVSTLLDVLKVFGLTTKRKRESVRLNKFILMASLVVGVSLISFAIHYLTNIKNTKVPENSYNINKASIQYTPINKSKEDMGQNKNEITVYSSPTVKATIQPTIQTDVKSTEIKSLKDINPTGPNRETPQKIVIVTLPPKESSQPSNEIKDISVQRVMSNNGQEEFYTNAPQINVLFNQAGLKEGPQFNNIGISGYDCKVLKIALDKEGQALIIDVRGKYGKQISINIPEGALINSNGRKNASFSYKLTPVQNKRLMFENVDSRVLEGWLKESLNESLSIFAIGDNLSDIHSGKYSAKIISTQENTAKYSLTISGIRNRSNYRLSGFIKTKDVAGSIGAILKVSNGSEAPVSKAVNGTSDWQLVGLEFNTKENDKVVIQCELASAKGIAWFDDLTLEELP